MARLHQHVSGPQRTVLVTGGSGFIGSHVVDRFVADGWSVCTPCLEHEWPWRLQHHRAASAMAFYPDCDLTDPSAILDIMMSVRPSVVVHVAAYGVRAEEDNPIRNISVNVLGTGTLLEAAARSKVARFVHIGSALEYSPEGDVLTEQTCLDPDTLYGATKAAASVLVRYYNSHRDQPTVTLRLFNCFGPREERSKLIPYVITTALAGGEVALTCGDQLRDFLFVQDAMDAIVLGANGGLDGASVYNVCSGQLVRVRDVANTIVKLVGAGSVKDSGRTPLRPQRQVLRGSAALLMVRGWKPRVPLDVALQATVEWYSRAREHENGYYPA